MTIKDVEKLTGLTAKSIRYYEAKELITVDRNDKNSYRSYSEEDVIRLKQIKLFRYLDFSIEEIRPLLDGEEEQIKDALRDKAECFSKQKETCENKQEMCLTLAKEYTKSPKFIEEYNEAIEFMESDEFTELIEELKDLSYPNLTQTIAYSLICLGPILWLFVNLDMQRYDTLVFNAVLALIGTVFITVNWMHYIQQYRKYKKHISKKNREWAFMGLAMLIACVAGIAGVIGVMVLAERIIVPKGYLFYEHHPIAGVVMIWLIMIAIILVCLLVAMKICKKTPEQLEKMNDIIFFWNLLGKWKPAALILWLIGMYLCMTSLTVVTENEIIYHSPIHPFGITYQYSDVEEITTGFGDKNFAVAEYKKKGNFFYRIALDGRKIIFHVPSVNEEIERYANDSYLELEEFDQALVRLGINKKSDEKGYESCILDKQFVERFLRIIRLR